MSSHPRLLVYLLRRDLRLSDNPIFSEISQRFSTKTYSSEFTHLLPLYVLSPEQIEVSGFLGSPENGAAEVKSPYPEARSRLGKFWRCGPHRAKFIGESVWDLKETLELAGSGLCIRIGNPGDVVRELLENTKSKSDAGEPNRRAEVVGVWMTGEVASEELREEREVRRHVERMGKEFRLFKDDKYFLDDDDLPFDLISAVPDVYTTFRKELEPLRSRPRKALGRPSVLPPFPSFAEIPPQACPFVIPTDLTSLLDSLLSPLGKSLGLADAPLVPSEIDLQARSAHPFGGGESSAHKRIGHLLRSGAIKSYKDTRNGLLGPDFSTKLSAFLALGCISARQVHAALLVYEDGVIQDGAGEELRDLLESVRGSEGFGEGENTGTAGVRFELLWRDYMRLCAKKFGTKLFSIDGFRGLKDKKWKCLDASTDDVNDETKATKSSLDRFLVGRTGISLIDASQRELFLTGYTSNRTRQNVASFLAKQLDIDWRLGAEWYECMLTDYDVSSNWGNWQYVAGVGNDPREGRIFNSVKQAMDYDSKGEYVKTWIPELLGVEVLKDGAGIDEEKLMGLFQPWRLSAEDKQALSLNGLNWVEEPLVKIPFSIGKKPRSPGNRGRGGYRGRGSGRGWGRWRNRGDYGRGNTGPSYPPRGPSGPSGPSES